MNYGGIFDLDNREQEISRLNEIMSQELKRHKKLVEPWKKVHHSFSDVAELLDIVEADDDASLSELRQECKRLERITEKLELERVFSDPLDEADAIVSINAGAGGTESCDWVSMLLRMYQRWAEKSDYGASIFDILPGEEAGVKNVTFFVRGSMAYGHLKAERGVHRLVRISPFDTNKRRHTSFASVDVIPEIKDTTIIEINQKDIRIDTYRSGGAGGQHVNKTDSAVRITHMPSGIVVQCQSERSQHKNRASALKVLQARLYQKKREAEEAERQKQYGEKKEIAWGSQIRSYVFHPYSMVKDHRTNCETSGVHAVMDGDIDAFIEAYLKLQLMSDST